MNVFIKKCFENGFVSVRDYFIKESIRKGESMVIFYDGNKMTIPLDELKMRNFQFNKKIFESKINMGQMYSLYDFYWSPDDVQFRVKKSNCLQMGFTFANKIVKMENVVEKKIRKENVLDVQRRTRS